MLFGEGVDALPEGMHAAVEAAVQEEDLTLRCAFQRTEQHAHDGGDAHARRQQHERTPVLLRRIEEELAARRSHFDFVACANVLVEEVGDETVRLALSGARLLFH